MTASRFRFDRFRLDLDDRQLRRDEVPVELNSRYFDALALLVREAGRLVSKDRLHEEVWRGVPVTDEALTQCVRTLRRLLGDEATRPRFIETVPKHGYRFIASVTLADEAAVPAPTAAEARPPSSPWRETRAIGLGGTAGGGVAGALGGLFYGFAAASEQAGVGSAAVSVLLVLVLLTTMLALVGAFGVAFGIAVGGRGRERPGWWLVAGGALGGLLVGAVVKLLGLDAFSILFGRSPGDITGAPEGVLLGGAVGLGAWAASRGDRTASPRRGAVLAGILGALAGIGISLAGGRLLGGSLQLLATAFPQSRLKLDQIGALLGEGGFGPISHAVTSGLEGALFASCVVGGILLARRAASGTPQPGSNRQPVGR